MALVVSSVVRRHMKRTESFEVPSETRQPPVILDLASGEELVGWYTNPFPSGASYIVFTNVAIMVLEGERRERLLLSDIVSYELPESKTDANEVSVTTACGRTSVPIRGRHGPANRYSDAWNLVQVLHTLISLRTKPDRA